MDIQKWKKKKEKARIDGNTDSLYYACKELAELYFNAEKYDLALQEYKEMERMSEISENSMDVGRANRMIGEVYCEKGEFEKAIRHQLKHLVISRDEHNKVEEQRALATLGRTYFLQAESITDPNSGVRDTALMEAKKYYMESLAICNRLTDGDVGQKQRLEMVARLFLNIGLVLDCQNQYESAIVHMQKAVSICKKLDLWEDLYRTYSALGGAFHKHHDKNQSIKTFDLALSVAERLSNKTHVCDVLQLKSEVLLDLPDVRGARQALLKAYKLKALDNTTRTLIERKLRIVALMCECEGKLTELSPETDFVERRKLYEDMGDAAAELGNFKLALIYYNLMLECVEKSGNDRKALIDSYISLAQTYKDDQQYSKALQFFQDELQLEEKASPEACKTLLNIAEVYQLLGRRTEMYETYEEAKLWSTKFSDSKLKIMVLSSLHTALIEDNKISHAGLIKKELNSLLADPFEHSSDEEEEPPREFGTHISLDDLTDEEVGQETREEKVSRTRGKRSANLEKRNEKGETPLHVAAIQGNLPLLTKLLDQGHRVDVKDYSGWTPLHEACNHGHSEVVKALLDRGAPINDRGGPHCDGVTPLLDAASNGNLDIVQLLLTHGASPLMRTNSGDSIIDCLSSWRRRRYEELGADLQGSILAQYSTLYKNLGKILENAGQKLSNKDPPGGKENSSRLKSRNSDSISSSQKSYENSSRLKSRNSDSFSSPQKPYENSSRLKSRNSDSFTSPQKPYGYEKKSTTNAANDYENTMKALRFRNSKPVEVRETPMTVRGLVDESDAVGDDWLEDDLRPQKKRRTGDFSHELIGRTSNIRPVTPPTPDLLEEATTPPCSPSVAEEESQPQVVQKPPSPPQPSTSSSNRIPELNLLKRKKKSYEEEWSERDPAPVCSPPPPHVPPQAQINYSCVKVRIEGTIVIVPVPGNGEGLDISWLATEASSRYKSLLGVEPVVQLEMEGGGLLMNSDPLSIIIHSGSLVEARVLSWNLSSPLALYKEACQTFKTDCDGEVSCALESCQVTGTVSLEEMYLKWPKFPPLLRALSHYQPLQSLILSSNNISDLHILDVAECVSKLRQLRTLDLSNTNITEKGLEKFSQCIVKNNGLKRLEEVKLGHNPLGDCMRALSALLNTVNHLRLLSLPDVGLTASSFPSFTHCVLDSVEVLDVSHNELGGEGVRELLGLLDGRLVRELRLAGSGPETVREVGFYLERRAPPNLRHLDLSYCTYNTTDLQLFISGVRMCETLESVALDGVLAPDGGLEGLLGLQVKELSLSASQPPASLALPDHMRKLVLTTPASHHPSSPTTGPYGLVLLAK